jgi:hypothetical protein
LYGYADRRDLRRLLAVFAVLAAPALVALAVLILTGGAVGGHYTAWHFAAKPRWLFALNGYDLVLSTLLTAALAFLIYALVKRGALRLGGAGCYVLAGYGVAFVVIPFWLLDTAFVDVRVAVMAALVLPSFMVLELPQRRARRVAAAAVSALILVNLGQVVYAQLSYREHYAEIVASFGGLKQGARVLVAAPDETTDPPRDLLDYPMFHAPTLAVHYANAFVPTLFTYPGKQPVLPREAVWRLALMQGGAEKISLLRAIALGRPSGPIPERVARWREDFDYLYLIGRQHENPLPEALDPIASGGRFTLYRIRGRAP